MKKQTVALNKYFDDLHRVACTQVFVVSLTLKSRVRPSQCRKIKDSHSYELCLSHTQTHTLIIKL